MKGRLLERARPACSFRRRAKKIERSERQGAFRKPGAVALLQRVSKKCFQESDASNRVRLPPQNIRRDAGCSTRDACAPCFAARGTFLSEPSLDPAGSHGQVRDQLNSCL